MNRPTILVDLDNVVYDWAKSMAFWLIRNDVIKGTVIAKAKYNALKAMLDYQSWEVWEDWGIPKGEFIRWWRLGIEAEEIYAKGPLVPGARKALWRLSDAEYDIHIATSRLTKFGLHDQIILNTASWLRDNNIPYRNIHFTDNKRAIIAQAIVDDRADNMGEPMHGKRFLFPANHNQGRYVTADEQRAYWDKIVEELT
jgi:5'(3')-deoxyribonucleotidase